MDLPRPRMRFPPPTVPGAGLRREVPKTGDDAVRGTDDDAAQSRLSALAAGYLPPDPYTSLVVKALRGPAPRRPPLINIGTYLRSYTLDLLVKDFLEEDADGKGKGKQIVSVGAGSDTRFWRMMANGRALHPRLAHYVEVDFPEVTARKSLAIKKHKLLSEPLGDGVQVEKGGTSLRSASYSLLPGDLRSFTTDIAPQLLPTSSISSTTTDTKDSTSTLVSQAHTSILDPTLPTLLLAECVFAYLPPINSESIVEWFGKGFESGMAVCYEMCVGEELLGRGDGDRFGKVMLQNLESRNIRIPGATAYPTLASHRSRFSEARGFDGAQALSVKAIWDALEAEEKARISRLEMLDELEELDLVLDHYCVSWGHKGQLLRTVGESLLGPGSSAPTSASSSSSSELPSWTPKAFSGRGGFGRGLPNAD